MKNILNIADLRLAAKKRLPRVVFDYIDGGAETEWTMRENARVFDDVVFRPRSAVATKHCDLRVTVLGETIDVPFLFAPVGSSRMFYPRGEEVAARVAGDAGTIYTLSTLAGCPVRDVKAATRGPVWYQLYLIGGRDVALGAIERAKSAGCSALVVTIDTPVVGLRERDVRNGAKELITGAPFTMVPYLGQMLARPRWLFDYLRDGGLMKFPNVVLKDGPMPYVDVGAALAQSMVSWDDFTWIRDAWQGPIVAKGVHTADDARQRDRSRRRGRGGVESRRTPTRRRRSDAARVARSARRGRWKCRGADGWRHPQRQRHREGVLPRRARRADRPRLRLRPRRRGSGGRHADGGHPALRHHPHDEAPRLRVGA